MFVQPGEHTVIDYSEFWGKAGELLVWLQCGNISCYRRMELVMGATDSIRIRIDPQLKNDLQDFCDRRGTSISQEIRSLLSEKLKKQASALERFDALIANSEQKLNAAGLPEPTIDEINLYVIQVREQRCELLSKAS
jgi:antitoxin component of RelBE/YafQ-DinJ toxin-antitoxin module